MNEIQTLIEANQLDEALRLINDNRNQVADMEAKIQLHRQAAMVYSKKQNWGGLINECNEILEVIPHDKQALVDMEMAKSILGFFHPDQFNP